MKSNAKARAVGQRWLAPIATLIALGCSSASDGERDPSTMSQVNEDLHGRPAPHRPPPNPHHGGHHGGHDGPGCAAGSPGSSGTGGSSSGAAGSPSGTGASSNEGGATSVGGSTSGPPIGSAGGGVPIADPCGDGIRIWNACDDGNTVSGDGCSATCEIEPGYVCTTPGSPCHQPRCGDGIQDSAFVPGSGSGAIGGSANGSGGSDTAGATGAGGASGTYYYEACDDGNTVSGDGCSATCEIEPGYVCTQPGSPCREPRCGDGYQDYLFIPGPGATGGSANGGASGSDTGGVTGAGGSTSSAYYEECDDGNTTPGDGCDATCKVEPGYVCTPKCREPRCGDGIVDYYYPVTGGDGGGAPSGGAAASGGSPAAGGATAAGGAPGTGGVIATAGYGGGTGFGGVEQCDDGNTVSGDGCSATCQVE